MSLDEIFEAMPGRLNADAANGVDAVVQFNCSKPRTVTIQNGECQVSEGSVDDYTVAITMEDDDLAAMLTGELDGMSAFMSGKIQLDGDMMFAQTFATLFSN